MNPAPVLAMRFLFGLALLAVGPSLVWDGLSAGGWVEAASGQGKQELGMLGLVLAALGVVAFARFQPVAMPWRPHRAGAVVASYLPFAVLWLGFVVGYVRLVDLCGGVVPPQAFLAYLRAAESGRPGFWLVVLGIAVLAPLAEEIVFRGYLQGALANVLPRWAAITITAVLFGLVHTLPYALPISLLGGLFGWLALRHGSLLPAVIAHGLHNTLIVLLTVCWPQSFDLLYPR